MASNLNASMQDQAGVSKKVIRIRRKATKDEFMNSTTDFSGDDNYRKKKIRVVKRRVSRGNSEF